MHKEKGNKMRDYNNNELLFKIRYEKQKKVNKIMEFLFLFGLSIMIFSLFNLFILFFVL